MKMQRRGDNGAASRRAEAEAKINDLERRLKEKIEVSTGFADPEVRARKLEQAFRYFDTNNSGAIDYDEFFAAMTKFNFVGVQREIEGLFNKYDEDASGTIDYREFSYYLFGIGERPTLDANSKNVVEKVKARILQKDGASGFHNVARILRRMDRDGSNSLDRDELMQGLRHYGITNVPAKDMQVLFDYFDRDHSGRVSVDEFLRGLKVGLPISNIFLTCVQSGMPFERKQLVRQAFNILDKTGDGTIKVEDILECYDFSCHPNVAAGKMTLDQAAEEMLQSFEQGGEVDGKVTWTEFLDYYKGISLSIDDDQYFELMIRNAWHISGGEGAAENTTCKRICVIHSDGSEEVVELKDDLGLKVKDRTDVLRRLARQGVKDVVDYKI